MNEEITLNVTENSPYVIGAIAYVEQLEDGARITIVDKNGTTTATVDDGNGIQSVTLNADYTLTIFYTDGTSVTTTSIRGETGASGVYVGEEEPENPDVDVWIDTTGDPYPIEMEITEKVDEWLDSHPEATTTVQDGAITVPKFAAGVVDATLTQTGHPADAKATGDAITADRTRLTAVEGEADALDARITNLAQLTDGSTTGDAELMDARVVGSTTYSTLHQAIDTEFGNVKSAINKIESHITTGKNLFNIAECQYGRTISATGVFSDDSLYNLSGFIKVTNGVTYYPSQNGRAEEGCIYYFFNTNRVFVSRQTTGGTYTPSADGFIVIRFNASYDLTKFQLETGGVTAFEPFKYIDADVNIPYSLISNNPKPEPTIITVGTTSGYDYTSLKDAIASITDASSDKPYTIQIYEGTYDILADYNLASLDSTFVGLIIPNYVNIEGVGSVDKIILKGYLGANIGGVTRNNVSTVNLWKNSKIKNVTVTAQNIRYCVHNDDYKTNAIANVNEVFEHCKFIYYEAEDSSYSIAQTVFGIGAYNGRHTRFIDCDFINKYSDGARFPMLIHNNVSSPLPCYWEFENCRFVGGGYGMKVSSAGSNQLDEIILKGNYFEKKIRIDKESSYASTTPEFLIRGYANKNDNGFIYVNGMVEVPSLIQLI